jgi:hypothetical protein
MLKKHCDICDLKEQLQEAEVKVERYRTVVEAVKYWRDCNWSSLCMHVVCSALQKFEKDEVG